MTTETMMTRICGVLIGAGIFMVLGVAMARASEGMGLCF